MTELLPCRKLKLCKAYRQANSQWFNLRDTTDMMCKD